ncbi:hypothetical protein FRB94_007934 [Tulasnella sp. JGI-2019a]|nr:hypothetical protein FRB93_012151 [Tulasnella sp. JGI-2019a]KAG9011701.1 hypothetical protein FRB94_007934 [Tulasnella sp. JGI-2019a]KAG9033794.1 hypothetical protein FRB95_014215 [Tulasnella sp. JGI-2019a]
MARLTFNLSTIAVVSAFFASAAAQGAAYSQCGGIGWTGATTCVSGWCCVYSNAYYSQCLQTGCSTATTSTTATSKTSTSSSLASSGVTVPITSTSTPATGTSTAVTTIQTLLPNWLWLRSDEAPYFHQYVRSVNSYAPGDVILGNYTTGGQFQIVNGQIEHYLPDGTFLYVNVRQPANSTVTYIGMYLATTQNTFGTFAFSGDAVTWTVASIARPNTSAFLVCPNSEGNALYINLGAYAYLTPTGCSDCTINYYNGATAVPRI